MPTINGTAGNDTLNGTAMNDAINGLSGNDTIVGLGGADNIDGGDGDDQLASHSIGVGEMTADPISLDIYADHDVISGGDGSDEIFAGYGDDVDGGTDGYNGDSLFISFLAAPSGVIVDFSLTTQTIGGGTITGVENLRWVQGSNFADTINAADNAPHYAGGNSVLGMGGNDHLIAGYYTYVLDGGDGDDLLDGRQGEILTSMHGGAGNDIIYTNLGSSHCVAFGDAGDDQIYAYVEAHGGSGNDTIIGFSTPYSGGLFGDEGHDTIIGAEGRDYLYGGDDNDILDGGGSADELAGGAGSDIFYVNDIGDVVIEASGEGTDEVRSSVAYTLGANLENLLLTGAAAINGTGNTLANTLRGNEAANILSGLAGADALYGNGGDDSLDGGEGDDYLFGGIGNDMLTGGLGHDRMYGGVGDDIYFVNDATDYAYENVGEGTDKVIATINHQLRANIEVLELAGSGHIRGYGNELDNHITGNAGDNLLYGRAGNDTLTGGAGYDKMYGGLGDDVYIVTDTTDFTYENAGEGHDKVVASLTHTLRANIEELELSGSADIRGYGNAENNLIAGNSGSNQLYGRDGNDTINGNAGNDHLFGENGDDRLHAGSGQDRFYGGAGADEFIFMTGDFAGMTSSNSDRIMDFSQAQGDLIHLGGVDANAVLGGDQAFAFIGSGAFTGTAGELRFYQAGTTTYVQGDTNGDGQADFLIRIDGLHTLGAGDFLL